MRRARFGSTTGGSLDALDAQLGTGNENGNNPDHDLVARDSTGSIVARYDESAGAWQFEGDLVVDSATVFDAGADTVGDGTTSANHQSVSTDELNNIRFVDPDTSDVGAAVNALISELSPEGGIIYLPREIGDWNTTVDLSSGINGQLFDTPITIRGHGETVSSNKQGTNGRASVFNCENLTDHAIKQTGSRSSIKLERFTLRNVPTDVDGVHLGGNDGSGSSEYCRDSVVRNLSVSGGDEGYHLKSMYGSELHSLFASGGTQAFHFELMNAASIENIIARQVANDGGPQAIHIDIARGQDFQDLYIESCEGGALEMNSTKSCSLTSPYLEANNTAGNAQNGIVIGNSASTDLQSSIVDGLVVDPANPYSGRGVGLFRARGFRFEGNRMAIGVEDASNSEGRHVFVGNYIDGPLDTDSGDNPSTFIANEITGTVTRTGGATVVSGD